MLYSVISNYKFKCPYLVDGGFNAGGYCQKNDRREVPDLKKLCANQNMELYLECPYYNKKIDPFAK